VILTDRLRATVITMPDFTTRPTLQGTFGMAASTHWLATATAMSVLERGGNAADAATAAGFVLQVVEPHLNGPGGEVPIVFSMRGAPVSVLCGQGVAPAGASAAHYRGLGLDLVPATGPLAAAVPGAVDAWLLLLRDFGTWSLREVLDHAIGYAVAGHPLARGVVQTIGAVSGQFEQHWPTSAAQWLVDGAPPRAGRLFANPALGATWRRLVAEAEAVSTDRDDQIEAARRSWREGFIAEAMVRTATAPTMDSSGEPHAGLLSGEDLAHWSATYESPVSHSWGRWTVHKVGGWSQGPVMLQQLALLGDTEPGRLHGFGTEVIHRLVEGAKLTMADRDAWYGDARPTPLDTLLGAEHNAARRALITDRASAEFRPSDVAGYPPRLAEHLRRAVSGDGRVHVAAGGAGEPTVRSDGLTRGDTCHLDVVDRWGSMISATPSGGWLQSNPTIPELGFCLGTRLQMAWLDEGLANTLTPGRRPRTTLTPSLASYEGVPTIAFGTPGGDQQDQWSTHLFLRVAAGYATTGELDLQAHVDAPNWHSDAVVNSFWPRAYEPNRLVVEANLDDDVIDGLRSHGHDVVVGGAWTEGRLSAVARHPDSGVLHAAANPRGMQGYAAGR
jgi:gamma-glutamyltranspeptidase/glutathione hydrolase